MAVVSRRHPSGVVSTGLSVATIALNVAGAAADAVPIAKQILNSAAHISAVAEKIQKKREAMYTLVEKADIYATQINIAVAGRILDASLRRRLERLYSVFLKIEALVDAKAGGKNNALTRVWQNVVMKPNRAEALVLELEREIQLFQLLTGLQLSLVVEDTARAVAADVRYDGQFRVLRDCDIDKGNIIKRCETGEGTVVWASARVDGQLMVIRYLESRQPNGQTNAMTTFNGSSHWQPCVPYDEYLENIKKVSTVNGSHPHVVQLYGRHVQGPETVFRSGTIPLWDYLGTHITKANADLDAAAKYLRLIYKMLDASSHLADVHGLEWGGSTAAIDENGEPRIGLFDDIFREQDSNPCLQPIHRKILSWFNYWLDDETAVVEEVDGSYLHAIMTGELGHGNGTDRLQRIWDAIRQERLPVMYYKRTFPVISGNVSLSQDLISRARSYFETRTKDEQSYRDCSIFFIRNVLTRGGATLPSRIQISIMRSDSGKEYYLHVQDCTHDDMGIHYDSFWIEIPAGYPALAEVARAAGLPNNFEHCWWRDDCHAYIYPQLGEGEQIQNEVRDSEDADEDEDPGEYDEYDCPDSEEEDENSRTADEGKGRPYLKLIKEMIFETP